MLSSRFNLPIYGHEEEIVKSIRENDIVVLSGDTGCGKTTQVPQIIRKHFGNDKRIAVTQPRRISCIGVATRVSQEMKTPLPGVIGISISMMLKNNN